MPGDETVLLQIMYFINLSSAVILQIQFLSLNQRYLNYLFLTSCHPASRASLISFLIGGQKETEKKNLFR